MKRNSPTELFDIIELESERGEKRRKTRRRNTQENEQTNFEQSQSNEEFGRFDQEIYFREF